MGRRKMSPLEIKDPNDLTNHRPGYTLEPGDNTTALLFTKDLLNLPKINLHDEKQVRDRLNEYMTLCARYDLRPSAMSMARALKMTRQTLAAIAYDKSLGGGHGLGSGTALPPNVVALLKDYYGALEVQWEINMQYGKINPVSGIFLGKNYYGMVDQVDYVVSPQLETEKIDAKVIRERYISDDEKKD